MNIDKRPRKTNRRWSTSARIRASHERRTGEIDMRYILSMVDIKPNDCWETRLALHKTGYSVITINRRQFRLHRLSYELSKGKINEGLVIDHICRNKACINPDHLRAVTCKENLYANGSIWKELRLPKSHCKKGHPLTKENTYINFNKTSGKNSRRCILCSKSSQKERYYKLKNEDEQSS